MLGLKITNKLKSQIQDFANNCEPAIKIILKEVQDILIVHVRSGEDKPYCCSSGFYTRIGPNAQKMTRNQIIEFFQSEGKIRFDELTNIDFNYNKDFDKKLNNKSYIVFKSVLLESSEKAIDSLLGCNIFEMVDLQKSIKLYSEFSKNMIKVIPKKKYMES